MGCRGKAGLMIMSSGSGGSVEVVNRAGITTIIGAGTIVGSTIYISYTVYFAGPYSLVSPQCKGHPSAICALNTNLYICIFAIACIPPYEQIVTLLLIII